MHVRLYLIALLLLNAIAWADTISLPLTDDTHIADDVAPFFHADNNYGSRPLMLVHDWGPFHSLVRFDASAVAGQTINSATLSLYLSDLRIPGTAFIHAITSPWRESTVTWNTGPTFESSATSSFAVSEAMQGAVITVDVTSLVQRWADGSLPDNGLLLRTSQSIRAVFDTKETPGGIPASLDVEFDTPNPTAPSGVPREATVLDFSMPPIVIDEPGTYVLDRDWLIEIPDPQVGPMLEIQASGVTVDLQGFELAAGERDLVHLVEVSGNFVTLTNGRLTAPGEGDRGSSTTVVSSTGGGTLLSDLRIFGSPGGFAVRLEAGGTVINSILGDISASGGQVIIRSNLMGCRSLCLRVSGTGSITDNRILSGMRSSELTVDESLIARNWVRSSFGDALGIIGNDNIIEDNVVAAGDSGIVVNGTRNTIESNIVRPGDSGPAASGIVFLQNANYFGNNRVSANEPFSFGSTTQVDWGGNVSY